MRLGELLVQEKLVSKEAVGEALESQVVHGGRLGTNLVELGLLDEKELARCLGKLHGLPSASGDMNPDPRAVESLPPSFCDDKDVVPMRVDQTRISVAIINPKDVGTLDQIAFKTGKRVTAVVIPEFRMNQLLRKFYKAFRNMRAIDMNTLRKSKAVIAQEQQKNQTVGEDLINEAEFQALYAQAIAGGEEREDVLSGEEVVEELPPPPQFTPARGVPQGQPPVARAQPPPPAANQFTVNPLTAQPQTIRIAADVPSAAAPQVPTSPPVPSAPPVEAKVAEPPPTPVGFAQAQKLLSTSSGREDVARTVLRFAISKWKRSLILSVQGPLVTGWHGAGVGVRPKAVQRIGLNTKFGSATFKLVCDTRSHYVGPVKRDASTNVFYKLLGGGFPQTAVILPLLVRGKIVHLLYVDNGPDQLTTPDIGELLILGQSVTRSYELLMKQRRSA